jgi:hypothetical protein
MPHNRRGVVIRTANGNCAERDHGIMADYHAATHRKVGCHEEEGNKIPDFRAELNLIVGGKHHPTSEKKPEGGTSGQNL